ncbi:PKD domain-containing protein [Sorangium sp. So ce1335]|uniref:c-type cytochrome n=1 Tax=Sorangium sp. So ce1335 TaxID=3133335 RepID=UPI003F60EDA6
MRSLPKLLGLLGGICSVAAWPVVAHAITASVAERAPSLAGEAVTFDLTIGDAVGPVQVRWDMGDETRTEFTIGDVQQVHTYAAPGHYPVLATVKDDVGFTSVAFVHTAHRPLVTGSAAGSTDLVYDQPNAKVYTANYDNDSVSVLDAGALTRLAEVPVARGPVGLALTAQGKLWVLHRDAHSLSIVDTASLAVEREVMLPYASQPMGLAISPTGDAAYVTLMAVGKLLKLDVASGAVLSELVLGGTPRGVSVSHDGSQIYVTRFISEDSHGEVARIDAATFQVSARFELAADTTTEDTDQQGRGLPNYLFSVGLSPDGLFAWVPGKKDNIFRGPFRDQLALTDDNTVRPLVALLNVAEGVEDVARRIDLDDRNLPNQVVFTPLGDYAFVSVAGSALVEVRDTYTGEFVTALKETGFAPRGLALTETDRLFVHASLSRTVAVYDVADIVSSHDLITKKLADIPTVAVEKLDAQVLRGKQLFVNSADIRMSDQGYISCASCHFDGAEDGRVWDFGSVGEGLRNTVSLLGRRGTGHGNVNWSGSFDEIQDSDDNIRDLFGGKGFLSAEQLAVGTVATPRGDKKAGLSPELDALAAFLGSLDTHRPSPFRNADGSLTQDGVAGRAIFKRLGCGFCHTGADGTDSAGGKLHDVGTVKASSGMRAGEPLFGIDTPTLNGVWETAPYLHDGSAPTLRDVLVTANPEDRHAFTSALSEAELGQLIAYVQQLDGTVDLEPSEGDGAGDEETSEENLFGCSAAGGRGDRHAPLLAFALVAGLMTFGTRRGRPA